MKRLMLSAMAALSWMAGPGAAQDTGRPAVIELYTSQGCSSCPPADAIFGMLAERPDVIALALHVDYWDYIGWADTFARPEHADRQRDYAQVSGERTIYTPQMVINGTMSLVGADPSVLDHTVEPAGGADGPVLILQRTGDVLSARTDRAAALPADYEIELVRYIPQAKVAVERGENAGRMLDYVNIVSDWQTVSSWDGTAPLDLNIPVQGDAPLVVLIQEAGPGAIVAAARLR